MSFEIVQQVWELILNIWASKASPTDKVSSYKPLDLIELCNFNMKFASDSIYI